MADISAWTLFGPMVAIAIMAWTGTKTMNQNLALRMKKDEQERLITALNERLRNQEVTINGMRRASTPAQRAVAMGPMNDCLPAVFMDAEALIVVLDRVPNQNDILNLDDDVPCIWVHARDGRCWKPTGEPGGWVETTIDPGKFGVRYINAFTDSGLFIHMGTDFQPGSREIMQRIGDSDTDRIVTNDTIRQLSEFTIDAMDRSNDTTQWRAIWSHGNPQRRAPAPDPLPPHTLDEGDAPRPIILDDPLDNESRPS